MSRLSRGLHPCYDFKDTKVSIEAAFLEETKAGDFEIQPAEPLSAAVADVAAVSAERPELLWLPVRPRTVQRDTPNNLQFLIQS